MPPWAAVPSALSAHRPLYTAAASCSSNDGLAILPFKFNVGEEGKQKWLPQWQGTGDKTLGRRAMQNQITVRVASFQRLRRTMRSARVQPLAASQPPRSCCRQQRRGDRPVAHALQLSRHLRGMGWVGKRVASGCCHRAGSCYRTPHTAGGRHAGCAAESRASVATPAGPHVMLRAGRQRPRQRPRQARGAPGC